MRHIVNTKKKHGPNSSEARAALKEYNKIAFGGMTKKEMSDKTISIIEEHRKGQGYKEGDVKEGSVAKGVFDVAPTVSATRPGRYEFEAQAKKDLDARYMREALSYASTNRSNKMDNSRIKLKVKWIGKSNRKPDDYGDLKFE